MTANETGLSRAISEWREILGTDSVLAADQAVRAYGANTIGIERRIAAALKPVSVDQLVEIVNTSRRHKIPLYPISTGRNWGYGGANPVTNDCVIVDLSGMRRILEMEPELGLVTVEPGVTQKQLRDYLDAHNLPFLVPVHGGGPDCSLVGNALERGYGITPYADHFSAVTALEAVLPNGEIYRSALTELGGTTVDRAYKWGMGPYIDGLFTQGNLGIVTRMTIALAPIPERVLNFFFWVEKDESLEAAVQAIRAALRATGMNCGSINLMNPLRILSMIEPFPAEQTPPGGVIPTEVIDRLARRNNVPAWMGTGAIYGVKPIAAATRSVIRSKLGPLSKRLIFLSPRSIRQVKMATPFVPGSLGQRLTKMADTLDATIKLIAGSPSEIALPLAYWRSGRLPGKGQSFDPDRDGCGLIWYSPLVPMIPESVRTYTEMVKSTCTAHGIDPLITLTSISDRCFDSTVPLLFDRGDRAATERAQACYDALFDAGQKLGFLPYRVGVQTMQRVVSGHSAYWKLAAAIKNAVDPDHLIAPGRYAL